MADKQGQIERINELSHLARAAWFTLLAYLVFVGITLLGVEDADFFLASRRTQLPLAGVEIPTASFFWTAPILGAALYTHLHLFLIKLWDAHVPPTSDADPTHHWLVNDFVLVRQGDPTASGRPLAWVTSLITILLVWVAGPLVLAYAWWRSMSAHDEWMSLLAAACLGVTLFVGATSWRLAETRLRPWRAPRGHRWQKWAAVVCGFVLLALITWLRTEGGLENYAGRAIDAYEAVTGTAVFTEDPSAIGGPKPADTVQKEWIAGRWWVPKYKGWLAPMSFRDERLSNLPAQWAECDIAKREYRAHYASQANLEPSQDWSSENEEAFSRAWTRQRSAEKKSIVSADFSDAQLNNSDFTGAIGFGVKFPPLPWPDSLFETNIFDGSNLFDDSTCALDWSSAELTGMNLSGARLNGAKLEWARLEGVNLVRATLDGAKLNDARLTGADLSFAHLRYADLQAARLEGANLALAKLDGANLFKAHLRGADLTEASLAGANLVVADLTGAPLYGANLQDADLRAARLEDANLVGTRLQGANLENARLRRANLGEALIDGANLRYADLRGSKLFGFAWDPSRALVHFADFRGAELNPSILAQTIGNSATLLPLPASGEPYFVWSCWETPPPDLNRLVATAAGPGADDAARASLLAEFLCGPDNPRRKTGTPLALDAPYPDGHPLAGRD